MIGRTFVLLLCLLITGIFYTTGQTSPPVPGIIHVPFSTWEANISFWEDELANQPGFNINTARLSVVSNIAEDVALYTQNDQCYGCPLLLETLVSYNTTSLLIQTSFGNYLEIRTTTGHIVCSDHVERLRERGEYWLIVFEESANQNACHLVLANDPTNYNLHILWAFLVFLGLGILWLVLKSVYRRCQKRRQQSKDITTSNTVLEMSVNDVIATDVNDKARKPRLRSLDTFRGLSLTVMIFVNYGGGGYYFFEHAHWDGLFVADLVFPWFVWIMGTSIAFALRSQLKRNKPKWKIFFKILNRTIKIFLVGLFLGARYWQDMKTIRIFGVLQRLALTYFGTALNHLFFAFLPKGPPKWADCCRCVMSKDLLYYWPEWVIMFCILAIHLCITYLLPLPGCPTGYVGPGGLHNDGNTFNCTGGAAQYIDRLILTESHMYQYPTIQELYKTTMPFDPEGILGTFTSIFMCFLGLQAGKIIMSFPSDKDRVIRWIIWSVITGIIGTVLCKGSQFEGWVPLNKNLWSVSFVFVLSSMAFVLFVVLYLLIDVWQVWSGAPFVYPGMNSIVVYVCHSVFGDYFPVTWQWPDYSLHWQRLFRALWGSLLWTVVAYVMYWKHIFIAL